MAITLRVYLQLSRLGSLDLSCCNRLQSLPELPLLLKWLKASDCRRLQSLPEIPSCLEELDASVPEKLSKHSLENDSLKDSSSINFLFTNCSKLMSEEANKKNLVDSQIRIQHMVIASLRLFKVWNSLSLWSFFLLPYIRNHDFHFTGTL